MHKPELPHHKPCPPPVASNGSLPTVSPLHTHTPHPPNHFTLVILFFFSFSDNSLPPKTILWESLLAALFNLLHPLPFYFSQATFSESLFFLSCTTLPDVWEARKPDPWNWPPGDRLNSSLHCDWFSGCSGRAGSCYLSPNSPWAFPSCLCKSCCNKTATSHNAIFPQSSPCFCRPFFLKALQEEVIRINHCQHWAGPLPHPQRPAKAASHTQ